MQVWSYRGGRVRPVTRATGKKTKRGKGFKLKANPEFATPRDSFDGAQFDLSKLDAELRKVAEEILR